MTDQARDSFDLILQRVCSEFLEMPGLRLTFPQAQRLWGLDERTCRQVLDSLVEAKFLWRQAPGTYARLTDGQDTRARPRMAEAALRHAGAQHLKKVI
jgi:hypothetical protein